MRSCREIAELANQYIDNDISFKGKWGMRLHLLTCYHCRRYVRGLRLVVKALGGLPQPTVDEDKLDQIVAHLRSHTQKEK